jgi:hypothetical protein
MTYYTRVPDFSGIGCTREGTRLWDFVRKKSSPIYLGPKNLDTFWCTAWNCQIIFRCASIHGRAGFILFLYKSNSAMSTLTKSSQVNNTGSGFQWYRTYERGYGKTSGSPLHFMLRRSSLVECVSVLHGTCLQCIDFFFLAICAAMFVKKS